MNDQSPVAVTIAGPAPKREAILRAALQVFAEAGVNGVAVPQIAARAGVGTGTIYRYFDSKEVLVNQLFREQKQALAQRLTPALEHQDGPRAAFAMLWEQLVAFAREAPDAYRFLELQDHRPYLDAESRDAERALLITIAARLASLQRQGLFRSDLRPEVLMTLVWGAFVQLFKAERDGHLALSEDDVRGAGEACWGLCQPVS